MARETKAAAEALVQRGIEAEIIDVATLKPLDMETIAASVEKTGRCVIVHEAPLSGGWGAEIAARLADEHLTGLLAPVKRVAGHDTVMPMPKMEAHYMPRADDIIAAALEVMRFQ
jgi:2-oxoisovalerate dehydrogenase E1 component beta subunit